MNTQICRVCNIEKDVLKFTFRKDSNKYRTECTECRSKYNLKLYHTSPKQRENHRRASWKHSLYKNYGLTVEEYNSMFEEQKHSCKICNTHIDELTIYNLFVDHCHTTGKVRGLLCNQCNSGLGMFKDRQDLLLKAIGYLNEASSS